MREDVPDAIDDGSDLEYEYMEVTGRRVPVLQKLNRKHVSRAEMDEIFNNWG